MSIKFSAVNAIMDLLLLAILGIGFYDPIIANLQNSTLAKEQLNGVTYL